MSTVTVGRRASQRSSSPPPMAPCRQPASMARLEVDTGAGELTVDRVARRLQTRHRRRRSPGRPDRRRTALLHRRGHIARTVVRGQAVLETIGGDIYRARGRRHRARRNRRRRHSYRQGRRLASTPSSGGGRSSSIRPAASSPCATWRDPSRSARPPACAANPAAAAFASPTSAAAMRVSTSLGNIMASLLGGRLADSYLATGNGDITVLIPSNVGVTIQAQNDMADTLRRINFDFPGCGCAARDARRRGRPCERRRSAAADFRHGRHDLYQKPTIEE